MVHRINALRATRNYTKKCQRYVGCPGTFLGDVVCLQTQKLKRSLGLCIICAKYTLPAESQKLCALLSLAERSNARSGVCLV